MLRPPWRRETSRAPWAAPLPRRCEAGGAGATRGGLGQRIELRAAAEQDVMVFLSVERITHPAKGRHGGADGAPGRIRIDGFGEDLPGKGQMTVSPGQTLIFETPGGGGFGRPEDRTIDARRRDLEDGLISDHAAREIYTRSTGPEDST